MPDAQKTDMAALIKAMEGDTFTLDMLRSPPTFDQSILDLQIYKLDQEIDAAFERGDCEERVMFLCASFRALNWARNPDSFSEPLLAKEAAADWRGYPDGE